MASPSEDFLSEEEWSAPSIPTPAGDLEDGDAAQGEPPAEQGEDWLAESPGRGPSPEQGDAQALVPLESAPVLAQPAAALVVAPAGGVGAEPLQGSLASLTRVLVEKRYADDGIVTLSSATAMADRLGIARGHFRECVYAAAHAAFAAAQTQVVSLVSRVLAATRSRDETAPVVTPLVFFRKRKYDGARMRLGTTASMVYDDDVIEERAVGSREIFVVKGEFGIVMRRRHGDACQFLHVCGTVPTRLSVLEGSAAEVVHAALRDQLDSPWDRMVDRRFPRLVDVACCDAASGNLRSERAFRETMPLRAQIVFLCRAHKKKKVAENSLKTIRPFDTNLVRCQMSLTGDHLLGLRHHARLLHGEQLVVKRGVPPADATAHRDAIWKLCSDSDDPTTVYRREVVSRLYNGDIRKHGVIEHYCRGCCESPRHTLFLMRRHGVPALFGRIDVLNRANWVNQTRSHRCVGVPAAVHGIFQASYLRAMPGKAPKAPRGAAGAEGGADADDENAFKEEQDKRVAGSRAWMLSGAVEDGMFLGTVLATRADACVSRQLATSGSSFEKAQQHRVSLGQPRTYEAWLAHEDANAIELLSGAYLAIFDVAAWYPLQDRTEATALKVYRMLARMGGVADHLVHRANRNWPLPLLYSLKDPSIVQVLGETKSCLPDECTEDFCSFYAGRLDSAEAMSELKGVLVMTDTDTADAERLHSVNQRAARFRVWTHIESVEEVSAHFTSHMAGDFDVFAAPRPDLQRGPAQKRKRLVCDPRRGHNSLQNWTWRAFTYMNGASVSGASSIELSEMYSKLSGEELEQYRLLAAIARDRHLSGERGFDGRRRARTSSASGGMSPSFGAAPICDQRGESAGDARPQKSQFADVPSLILQASPAARAAAIRRRRREGALEARVAGEVREAAAASRQPNHEQDNDMFSVVDRAAAPVGDIEIQVDTGMVLKYRRRASTVTSDAANALEGDGRESVQQRASAWVAMHRTLTVPSAPPLGRCSTPRRCCHEAETCFHEDGGDRLLLIEKHIRAAFAALRAACPDKGAKASARTNWLHHCNITDPIFSTRA
ncbi:unnamed protein product [Prorocentrum cordatum]|uniref:Uncharacterized protein n=1 Tax=Prorocentrum cordatum TaxID=2364126 RepID=A0ABN9QX69_9DINO|nr:unnamed protein product [Polarella glacialis]